MDSFTYTVSDSSATVFGVSYQNFNQVAFDPTIDYSSSIGMEVEASSIKVTSQVTEFPPTVFYLVVGITTKREPWTDKASWTEVLHEIGT